MLILGSLLLILLGASLSTGYAVRREFRIWNKGICEENNLPWIHFDTDSQGGRGYKAGDRYCWITCPWVDQ